MVGFRARAWVWLSVLCACSDGVAVPIQRVQENPEAGPDEDGRFDEDSGVDERDRVNERYCEDAVFWLDAYAQDERALLESINARRAEGMRCEGREADDLEPLELSLALRCSARLHSRDMVRRGFTDRINPDGDGPRDRMRAAGLRVEDSDESILGDARTVEAALEQLLDDEDDCSNLSSRQLTHIGIGRFEDHWTLDFARD